MRGGHLGPASEHTWRSPIQYSPGEVRPNTRQEKSDPILVWQVPGFQKSDASEQTWRKDAPTENVGKPPRIKNKAQNPKKTISRT